MNNKLTYEARPIDRLRRFLCLGATQGKFTPGGQDGLVIENCQNVVALVKEDGIMVVNELVEFSVGGRAAKEDNILFSLAIAARMGNDDVRKAAYEAVSKICRTFSSLTKFIGFYQKVMPNSKGWGKGMRRAVANWYTVNRDERTVAYQITKYPQRNDMSHRDVLLLSHTKPDTDLRNLVFKYGVKGYDEMVAAIPGDTQEAKRKGIESEEALILIDAVNTLKGMRDAKEAAKHIEKYGLVHEHVPTEIKNAPEVWEALLQNMPVGTMVRSLGKMTSYGLLGKDSESAKKVIAELGNTEQIKRARIHPYNVLMAYNIYTKGEGIRSKWVPNPQISNALDDLLYESFKYAPPSGKRLMMSVDVSPSMSSSFIFEGVKDKDSLAPTLNNAMTARQAAAVMCMAAARVEAEPIINCFSDNLAKFPITSNMKLKQAMELSHRFANCWGGTDCSLPFRTAMEQKKEIDCFIVFTDNDTKSSNHPMDALRVYRDKMGVDARLIVVAFSVADFTIGDPEDGRTLDVVGFDSNAPSIISNFAAGRI